MTTPPTFPHSDGFLEAIDTPRSTWAVLVAFVLPVLWGIWFFGATITLYETSDGARLESRSIDVEAPLSGRLLRHHLVLGGRVDAGAVLVELEDEEQRLLLQEEQARVAQMALRLEALRAELANLRQALADGAEADRAATDEIRARAREAQARAGLTADEADRARRLHAAGHLSDSELDHALGEQRIEAAASEAWQLAVDRVGWQRRSDAGEARASLARLEGEGSRIEGDMAVASRVVERLEYDIARRRVQAPAGGTISAVADLQAGAFVEAGEHLATVVPDEELHIIAEFRAAAAVGRIRPGQPARLRLEGFPWTRFGEVAARVDRVGGEARDGWVRVELHLLPDSEPSIPTQHGLLGVVEVEIERLSPAGLVLRTAGRRLDALRSGRGDG